MTIKECSQLVAMIRSYYPSYYAKADESTLRMNINLMHLVLGDIDQELAVMAFYEVITSAKEFAPTPGQLLAVAEEIYQSIKTPMIDFLGNRHTYFKSLKVRSYIDHQQKVLSNNSTKLLEIAQEDKQ